MINIISGRDSGQTLINKYLQHPQGATIRISIRRWIQIFQSGRQAVKQCMHNSQKKKVVQSSKEFVVESIVGKKRIDGVTMYKVLWKGYPENEATWEPADNLENVFSLIKVYEEKEAAKRLNSKNKESTSNKITLTDVLTGDPKEEKKNDLGVSRARDKSDLKASKAQRPTKSNEKEIPQAFNPSKFQRVEPVAKAECYVDESANEFAKELPFNEKRSMMKKMQKAAAELRQKAVSNPNPKRSLQAHIDLHEEENENQPNEFEKTKKLSRILTTVESSGRKNTSNRNEEEIYDNTEADDQEQEDNKQNGNDFAYEEVCSISGKETLNDRVSKFDNTKKLNQSQALAEQPRNIRRQNAPSTRPNEKHLFQHNKRYKKLDEIYEVYKQKMLLSIISRQTGTNIKKSRLKMLEYGSLASFNQKFGELKKVYEQALMEKMQILVKLQEGWLALGSSKLRGFFMIDVNLLHENVWEYLLKTYSP